MDLPTALVLLLAFTTLAHAVVPSYDYLTFENLDVVRGILDGEIAAIPKLRQLRKSLWEKREAVAKYLAHRDKLQLEYGDHRNPTDAYATLKHLFVDLRTVSEKVQGFDEAEGSARRSVLEAMGKEEVTPNEVNAAVQALVFLFDSYKLSYSSATVGTVRAGNPLPHGSASEFSSAENLTCADLARMASAAMGDGMYDVALDIFREMRALLDSGRDDLGEFSSKKERKKLEKAMRRAVEANNKFLRRRSYLVGKDYQTLPWLVDEDFRQLPDQSSVAPKRGLVDLSLHDAVHYFFRHSCRASAFDHYFGPGPPPRCHSLHHGDPHLRLGPHKLEVLSASDPYLVQIHDILTEAEIDWIVEAARPNLSRTRIVDDEASAARLTSAQAGDGTRRRIVAKTVQTWINDADHPGMPDRPWEHVVTEPVLFKITKRLEKALKFQLTSYYSSNSYQVTNYGLGGLCEPHVDPHGYLEGAELPPSRQELVHSGDILGTFMAYLNDVEGGGATTFLAPGRELTAWPRKGSAAFWVSLSKAGMRDLTTNHGGCPVLKGSKWILNKWVYMFDQFREYPCGLGPNEKFAGFEGVYK